MNAADASDAPAGMPRVNRRITTLILGFAVISALASVLPLLPDVQEWVPLGLVSREGALTLYAGALLAFTALCMPLVVVEDEGRAGLGAWWWFGGLLFVFAAVPLYILAYIAGVHRDAVVEILAWAGVVHGAALLILRGLGMRRAAVVVALAFALLVVLPASDYFSGVMGLREARFDWTPSARVLALTQDYRAPRPVLPLVILVLIHVALYWAGRRRGAGAASATLLGVILGAAMLGAAAHGGALDTGGAARAEASGSTMPEGLSWRAPSGDRWVPGRAYPLRIEAGAADGEIEVAVGSRESWIWRPETGSRVIWIYPRLARAGERIEIRRSASEPLVIAPERLAEDRVLVLAVGERARRGVRPAEAAEPRVLVRTWESADVLAAGGEALDPFSAVVLSADLADDLPDAARTTLVDFAARGGRVLELGADANEVEDWGKGGRRRLVASELTSFGRLAQRRAPVADARLYDQFALPDWGRVDLAPLVTFLGVYHLVFLLIFLVPLRYDGRKRLSVYLVSVGFVLGLVVCGSYFALTRRYLPRTQVLQQDLFAAVLRGGADEDGPTRLDVEELVCFASFNEAPARIEIADRREVSPVYRDVGSGVGRVEVGAEGLVFPALPLDRFARKQVVSFRSGEAAPLVLRPGDAAGTWELVRRPGVPDPRGLAEPERIRFGFARRGGQLFGLTIDGDRIRQASAPMSRAWSEVGPKGEDADETRAFLRALVARHVDRDEDVLVLVIEGLRMRHERADYLSRREILQVLILPIASR